MCRRRVSVCVSVTRQYCVKTAKRRISLQVACITSVVGRRFGPPKNFGVAPLWFRVRIKFMGLYGRPPLALAGFLVMSGNDHKNLTINHTSSVGEFS